MAGPLTMARAMATRCCSPPESARGLWCRRFEMPSMSRISLEAVVEGEGAAGDVADDLDVLLGGEGGEQVVLLEDEADGALAEIVALASRSCAERSRPLISTEPEVGGVRPPRMLKRVDLPEPEVPTMDEELAARDLQETPLSALIFDFADFVGLEEVA